MNSILGGIAEIIACVFAIFTIDRFGRKPILMTTFFISGLACIGATVARQFSNIENGKLVMTRGFSNEPFFYN